MLDDIIISRVRVKILELFLLTPKAMFHVREIVRRLDEEINAVRRELSHLEKAGLMAKEPRANRLFYTLRKDYPLHDELLRMMGKTSALGGDILKNKPKLGKVKFAMLSARYLKGLPQKSSTDVDLLIVGTVVLPELSQIVKIEENRRQAEINYTVMTEEEFIFRKSRRDPFVISVLGGSRVMLIGDEEELLK